MDLPTLRTPRGDGAPEAGGAPLTQDARAEGVEPLRRFDTLTHEALIREFQALDKKVLRELTKDGATL